MFSFTSKLKRLPFFLTTLAAAFIFIAVCASLVCLPPLIAGYGLDLGVVTSSFYKNFSDWTPYLITFMVSAVVLSLIETVAIIRRVNDITDGRVLVSLAVAALFIYLVWNSMYSYNTRLYICAFTAVAAVLFFVPSNLFKKS